MTVLAKATVSLTDDQSNKLDEIREAVIDNVDDYGNFSANTVAQVIFNQDGTCVLKVAAVDIETWLKISKLIGVITVERYEEIGGIDPELLKTVFQ